MVRSKKLLLGVIATVVAVMLIVSSAFTGKNVVKAEESVVIKDVQVTNGRWEDLDYGKDGYFIFSSKGIYSGFEEDEEMRKEPLGGFGRDPLADYLGVYDEDTEVILGGSWNGNYMDRSSNDDSKESQNSLLAPGSTTERTVPRFHNSWVADGGQTNPDNCNPGGWLLWLETVNDNQYITLFISDIWKTNTTISAERPVSVSMWQNAKLLGQSKVGPSNSEQYYCTEENLVANGANKIGETVTLTTPGHFVTFKTGEAGKYYFLLGNPGFDATRLEEYDNGGTTMYRNPTVVLPILNAIFFDSYFTSGITYVLPDGATKGDNPDTYIEGQELVLKDAVKEGYNFEGWYLDSVFTQKVTVISEETTGNVKLYANFVLKSADPPENTGTDTKEEKTEDKGGCGSFVGSTIALVSLVSLGACAVVSTRKKED